MDLVIRQVMELEHIDDPDGHVFVEGFTCTTIEQHCLAAARQACTFEFILHLLFVCAIEHCGGRMNAGAHVLRQRLQRFVRSVIEQHSQLVIAVDSFELRAEVFRVHFVFYHLADRMTKALRCPTEMGLEDLTNVHARRHAERVQHDVDRRTVGEIRHVLLGENPRDDTLISVTAGHLVTDAELALNGDVDLHHLKHARRQFVALLDSRDLLIEHGTDNRGLTFDILEDPFDLFLCSRVVHLDFSPATFRDLVQDLICDFVATTKPIHASTFV